MEWICFILGITSIIGIIYVIKYYMVTRAINNVAKQIQSFNKTSDLGMSIFLPSFQKDVEKLASEMNVYIEENIKMRAENEDRVNKLRQQIENISHDLRTPLTSIMGYISLIDMSGLPKEDKKSLEIVKKKAKSLQKLICNFYDLSRLELDDYNLQMESIDIARLLRENLLVAYNQLEESGLEIKLNVVENSVYMMGDEAACERIFQNVITNALRYAKGFFKVSLIEEDEKVIIKFENETEGLTNEDVEQLFDRFYMSDKSRNNKGTGLGLTISKLLAKNMGGEAKAILENNILTIQYTFSSC